MNKEEIYSYCLKLAKNENIEFSFRNENKENVSLEKFSVGKTNISQSSQLLVKVIYSGQIGEYTISNINKENIKQAINKAKKIAKLKNNIKIKEFPSKKSKQKIKKDKDLENINFDSLIEKTKKYIKKEKYIKSYEGGLQKSNIYEFYINPYIGFENNNANVSLAVNINTKYKKASSAYYLDIFTKKEDININNTFCQAKINAYRLLNPKKGKKDKYDLIFVPSLTKEIIDQLILPATIGEAIYKKESYLSNLKNKKVFSRSLSLLEDPKLDYFLGSSIYDDEGNLTTQKNIIDKGIFKKEIYDIYGAKISGKKSTGNGFRSSLYSSINCEHTNILQKPGSKKIDNIIKDTKKGILVYGLMGFHTSNLTNGEFSLTINQGKEIIDGKFKDTITNLNFTGNCKTSFKNMSFSKEQKFFGDSLYSFGILKNKNII
jgi:PmbA protein